MTYKVVQSFTDLKDGDKVYRIGDVYEGTDETRIEELVSTESKGRHESLKGKPLIELDGEPVKVKTPKKPKSR